ncbi:unnamed protein product [Prorocentrum cordatum]|uniref:Condensin complex subunit 2 n=1 Tax=Prorocentrum cordatum TaxID=2364126 RepID=A0ABN9T0C9_9DINO|nr:unnamed protein product [Polarella glacialis]
MHARKRTAPSSRHRAARAPRQSQPPTASQQSLTPSRRGPSSSADAGGDGRADPMCAGTDRSAGGRPTKMKAAGINSKSGEVTALMVRNLPLTLSQHGFVRELNVTGFDDAFAAQLAEARALLGIDADDSASEAEEQDDDVDADAAYEAALAEARVLFELGDDLFVFAAKLTDDEPHEVAVENGDGARKVPVRVAGADLEDSPSEYDEEWEQVYARDWAKVATTSRLPAAKAADPPDQSRRAATRRAQRPRRRRRAGAQPASRRSRRESLAAALPALLRRIKWLPPERGAWPPVPWRIKGLGCAERRLTSKAAPCGAKIV